MRIRYTIEEISLNGTKDTRVRDIEKSEIIVGRGSGCDVLLDSNYVSLVHAKLGLTPAGELYIEDQGSLSGVHVNDRIITRAVLTPGDLIKLGNITLIVTFVGSVWGLVEKRKEGEKLDTEALVAKEIKSLALPGWLFNYKFLSVVFCVVLIVIFGVLPVTGWNRDSWSSGPISNNHLMIGGSCESCHVDDFGPVKDGECIKCHKMSDHALSFAEKQVRLNVRCAECHMEHNGDVGLVRREPKLCTNCHQDLKSVFASANRENIPGFDSHTEFFVRIQPPRAGGAFSRVRLDETLNPMVRKEKGKDPAFIEKSKQPNFRDNSNVKLNHEKHLDALKSPKGTVRLHCKDCHKLADNFREIEPITFEKHCESCHTLEFDDRLQGKEVPHGDPDVVYKFLYAEYAKLLLGSRQDPVAQETFGIRLKPGAVAASVTEESSKEEFTKSFVETESRKAEDLLFSKTACHLCHLVIQRDITEEDAQKNAMARYQIITPQIPTRWMPGSIFSHGAHEEVQCEDCHNGVRESIHTVDILLPRVAKCQECHGSRGKGRKVQSDCVMCHSFHTPLPVEAEKKRTTEEILKKP